jgi:hydrogenase large subunit
MAQIITIDPVSRISGFLEINAEVEQNTVTDARTKGMLYRGFEVMLRGRPPLDAVFFTERICGICSAAHAYASTLALEDALHINTPLNDTYIREIIHGFEFIQNHLRHFYLMMLPGFADIATLSVAKIQQYTDFRIPADISRRLEEHYIEGIECGRLSHEGQAVFGGKAPHNHGIFVGGTVTDITAYKLAKVKAVIGRLLSFVSEKMKEDADTIAYYYPDYYQLGISYPNFLSYGVFDHEEEEISFVKPGVLVDKIRYPLQPENITEHLEYTWLNRSNCAYETDLAKKEAYSFIKAPRYRGLPMEVGPLARMLISGSYTGGHSCMDRIYARVLETEKILNIMKNLADRIEPVPNGQRVFEVPDTSRGAGLLDTTRGALGHWITIKDKLLEHYEIITPSNWNISPKDIQGNFGTIEKALVGTVLKEVRNPVELGRIIRSFDPCVSCATHLIGKNGRLAKIELPV